ncbi:MAG: response regulator [Anaerolineae bacterium]
MRRILRRLYEPTALRKSPLLGLLALDSGDGASALQRLLLSAIDELKPAGTVPRSAKPWRAYLALQHLYVQQFSQAQVANTLAISTRQLRRQEHLAMQLLADRLWSRYGLEGKIGPDWPGPDAAEPDPDCVGPTHQEELDWVQRSVPTEATDLAEALAHAEKTAAPLAAALAVCVEWQVSPSLPLVAVRAAALRQALLNALTTSIRNCQGGNVRVVAEARGQQVVLTLWSNGGSSTSAPPTESLKMARQLVEIAGGVLEGSVQAGSLVVRIALPAAEQRTVLVIDDNVDTLQLFRRYLSDSAFPFVGTADASEALALATRTCPLAIVLDVMLPGIDGWELLGHLREHPATQNVPVIICSILPEEQLALTLGAAAYLRKPVSRYDLLETLQRLCASDGPQPLT